MCTHEKLSQAGLEFGSCVVGRLLEQFKKALPDECLQTAGCSGKVRIEVVTAEACEHVLY